MSDEPPQRFFDDLWAAWLAARAELAELGFNKFYRTDSLPLTEWLDGWWNCRGIQVFARDAYGTSRRAEREVVAADYRRRVRRVRRR